MALDASRRKIVSEEHVKQLIKDWLAEYYPGSWSYAPIQTAMGEHGIHDRVACVPVTITETMVGKTVGLFVSIEAKRPGRRNEPHRGLSANQARIMGEISQARGITFTCDGEEDLQMFNDWIGSIRRGSR